MDWKLFGRFGGKNKSAGDFQAQTNKIWDAQAVTEWSEEKPPQEYFVEFCTRHWTELGLGYTSDSTKKPRALNIGSAAGRYLKPLAKYGFNVVGLEPSKGMRERSLEVLTKYGLVATVEDGVSKDLSRFPDNSFRFVVSAGGIHHNNWADVQKSIAEARRVLKPGGYLLFEVRSVRDTEVPRELVQDVGATGIDLEGSRKGRLMHLFSRDEILKLAQDHDFEVIGLNERSKPGDYKKGTLKAHWWVEYKKKL